MLCFVFGTLLLWRAAIALLSAVSSCCLEVLAMKQQHSCMVRLGSAMM
jgi:hypothetical protein